MNQTWEWNWANQITKC